MEFLDISLDVKNGIPRFRAEENIDNRAVDGLRMCADGLIQLAIIKEGVSGVVDAIGRCAHDWYNTYDDNHALDRVAKRCDAQGIKWMKLTHRTYVAFQSQNLEHLRMYLYTCIPHHIFYEHATHRYIQMRSVGVSEDDIYANFLFDALMAAHVNMLGESELDNMLMITSKKQRMQPIIEYTRRHWLSHARGRMRKTYKHIENSLAEEPDGGDKLVGYSEQNVMTTQQVLATARKEGKITSYKN